MVLICVIFFFNTYFNMKILSILTILFLAASSPLHAQDTLRVSFDEFILKATENSGQIKYEQTKIKLADNRLEHAKDLRFLPRLGLESEHSLVPGATSPNGFPEEQIYLDPDAYNDWDHVGLFTRFRISGVQPVFTWGAINKAIDAARIGVKAAEEEYQVSKAD